MWDALGPRTIQTIAAGSHALAVLWESAWKHGQGNDLPDSKLVKIPEPDLQNLYTRKTNPLVPSFRLSDPEGYKSVL
jgi:hypothetical protein